MVFSGSFGWYTPDSPHQLGNFVPKLDSPSGGRTRSRWSCPHPRCLFDFPSVQCIATSPWKSRMPRRAKGIRRFFSGPSSQQIPTADNFSTSYGIYSNPGDVSRLGIQAKLPSFRHPKVKSGLKTKSFHRWLNTTDGSHAKHGHSKIRSLNPSVLMATAWPKKHEKTVGIAAGCSQVSASTLIPVPTWGSEGSWLISNNVCKTIGSTIPKFTMFMSCINHQSTWVVYDATSLTSWSPGAPPNATGDINHLRI